MKVQCVILANADGGQIREETLDGRRYVVAPAAILEEGVLAGLTGTFFYPKDEVMRSAFVWNMKPAILGHSMVDGEIVSAASPSFIETQQVGFLMNTAWDETAEKLRTEVWFDEEKSNRLEPRLLERLRAGKKVEVSTGAQADFRLKAGEWNGQAYKGMVFNIRADHLAILMDEEGAYPVRKGGGLLANAAAETPANAALDRILGEYGLTLLGNVLSYDETRQAVYEALRNRFGEPGKEWCGYVADLYDGTVVWWGEEHGPRVMMSLDYTKNDAGIVLDSGEPKRVLRVYQYAAAPASMIGNVSPAREDRIVDKKALVDGLIGKGYEEADREALMALPDAVLQKTHTVVLANQGKQSLVPPVVPVAPPPAPRPMTMEEWRAVQPAEILVLLDGQMVANAADRVTLTARIKDAPANSFTDDQLTVMSIANLRATASLVPATEEETVAGLVGNYFGNQGGVPASSKVGRDDPADAPTPLKQPKMTFAAGA